MLRAVLERLPRSERDSLELGPGERLVPGVAMEDRTWLAQQLSLRGQLWSTDDRRVLVTLWWYSASVWTIGPTLTALALFDKVLSADPADLSRHWLPDSRVTGAYSSRLVPADVPVRAAGQTIRHLYERVIPTLADLGGMRPRPLWAVAADSMANRLLWLGQAVGDVQRVTGLLDPLIDAVGQPLPPPGHATHDPLTQPP